MLKKLGLGISLIFTVAACVEEDIRRLQTDQSYEGEEAYLISSLIDEQLMLLWQPISYYADSSSIAQIPGCPEVDLDSANNEVTLSYNGIVCADLSDTRSGKIVLSYTPLSVTQGYRLLISYLDYTFQGTKLTGVRTLQITAQNRNRRVFSDVSSNLLVQTKNKSSSRINFALSHEVSIAAGRVTQGISTGGGVGRNWVGREVTWEITEPKRFPFDCTENRQTRPSTGQEIWTITRSARSDISHVLSFYIEPECVTHTIIQLDEGVEMKKAP